jgi:spermidine synthase
MSIDFEELDYRQTPLGELILRRRGVLSMGGAEVFEVKLDDRFLMSSLVNESEIALAELALGELEGEQLDVVVGGLGLGYTARAALDHAAVRSVLVIEYLSEVIDWHLRGLVPLGAQLMADQRCRIVNADFFALLNRPGQGLDPQISGRRFHAVLLDIDHSPRSLLHPSHGAFYEPDGLRGMAPRLHPGGVFALWSADLPDEDFLKALGAAFAASRAHAIKFYNPLLDCDDTNTVYVARTGGEDFVPQ